ncbi:hypothetical protein [Conexibacter woesei]|uniref:Uncharacterized protein n=1 Tax=Conexibacter woesei (strain DSM 14684 / CCUG 47730 / CIP 108061 / JCM 11494 / NBRC 100937 / ID131577) TaxID=469383 RepID=D3FC81_CONWI|nr:hypothetical protein [Conexibacter woesei]ADB53376.1 hypothetical protein Cwoe_4965 [Conexibacter woesei DSM 14684]
MEALLHRPTLTDPPDGLSADDRRRLLETVARAAERAAAAAGVAPRWAGAVADAATATATAIETELGISTAAQAAQAPLGPARRGPSRSQQATPAGASQPLPPGGELTTSAGERIVNAAFPSRVVLARGGSGAAGTVRAGGRPYVRAATLARAAAWGRLLHAAHGFAVLAAASGELPFHAVPLERPLDARDLGPLGEQPSGSGAASAAAAAAQRPALVAAADFAPVLVVTRDDRELRAGDGARPALAAPTAQTSEPIAAADVAAVRAALPELGAVAAAAAPPLAAPEPVVLEGETVYSELVVLPRALLLAMPWQRRAAFLQQLAAAPAGQRERTAIRDLLRATRSLGEIEASVALLRRAGAFSDLIGRLDEDAYDVIALLGAYRGGPAPAWPRLVPVVADERARTPAPDPDAPLLPRVDEESRRIVALTSDPPNALLGLRHVAELDWTFSRAQAGDRGARELAATLALRAARQIGPLLVGLGYATEVGTGPDTGGEPLPDALVAQVRIAIVAELAARLVAIRELRTALAAPTLAQRIGALARALPGLRLPEDRQPELTLRLAGKLPASRVQELLHTLGFVPPEYVAAWSTEQLVALGSRPRAMAFVREAGGETFVAVLRRGGGDWSRFERFLDALAAKRARIADPEAWQRLLDRLATHGL